MVLANVSATITILLLVIVGVTSAATGNTNLRRSIAAEDDELPFTTATLNDNDNDTNNTNNNKHSPTIRKMDKIRSLHVSANHRRLVLDGSLVHDNEEGRDEETVSTVENERELAYYRYDGICEENGQFKLKFQVTVDSDLEADETIEQLNTFYKDYVSEFNPNDYNNVEMIYYSSLQPTEEEGNFILWIDGDCIGNVDPAAFLSSVHKFLTADNNLRSTLGEVSVMNCKRFRNSYTCSTPVVPWVSDATTSTPVTTSTSSATAIAGGTSSTTVESVSTSSTTSVQATTTTTQPPPITTSSSTSYSNTQAGAVQVTPSPIVTPTLSPPTEPVLDCPGPLDKSKTIDTSATLYYAVVPSSNGFDNGIMCGRMR